MRLTLVGSRFFGAAALERLLKEGIEIARVIVPAADDRLALAAKAAGLEVVVLDDPTCFQMMSDFIEANPELWNEDIGVE